MAARPTVTVFDTEGKKAGQAALPAVFTAPIRADIVSIVHTNMAKNHRQPYAVSAKAGHQTSAESWGTGRAVSRIPRVPGGGTHRAGQAAFGNMCRGGHMFAPTKTWRRWHRKVNLKEKRFAVCSALAASAVPSLVMARGHRVEKLNEIPLVVSNAAESIKKTKDAMALLEAVGASADVARCVDTKRVRTGKGKWRNRRYVTRKGPMVIYNEDNGITKAFRNIPGVAVAPVSSLNLLDLAPGGHMGRFCVWTQGAIEALDATFGTQDKTSAVKGGWKIPKACVTNSDVSRLVNDGAIQSIVNAPKEGTKRSKLKKNPLKNLGAMLKLNPYYAELRREAAAATARKAAKAKKAGTTRAQKMAFFKSMTADSDYQAEEFEAFESWLDRHNQVERTLEAEE
jgi:large subunit ribosomal protein L4e